MVAFPPAPAPTVALGSINLPFDLPVVRAADFDIASPISGSKPTAARAPTNRAKSYLVIGKCVHQLSTGGFPDFDQAIHATGGEQTAVGRPIDTACFAMVSFVGNMGPR